MAYKDRVKQDLDRWIGAGLIGADKREAILATIPEARRLDAATALAWVGGVLLGIAVIAFVAANWDAWPRLARFALVLAAFAAFAAGGAWAARAGRPVLCNMLVTVAALVFAAAVGLTGQIFDIAGDPRAAAYISGVAAFVLALAAGSTGAACVGLVLIALGDFGGGHWFSGIDAPAPGLLIGAPLGAFLTLRWGSAALAHLSALAILACFVWFAARVDDDAAVFLFLAILSGSLAAGARWLHVEREQRFASVFYGWLAWGALLFFAIGGYLPWFGAENAGGGIAHRIVWLVLAGGLVALGRFDRHMLVTAIGVLGLIGGVCALLMDLGLDLLAAAGVFLLCAIIALIAGFALRKRGKADA